MLRGFFLIISDGAVRVRFWWGHGPVDGSVSPDHHRTGGPGVQAVPQGLLPEGQVQ